MHPTTTLLLAGDRAAGLLREAERERLARSIRRPIVDTTEGLPRRPVTGRRPAILDVLAAIGSRRRRPRGAGHDRRACGLEKLAW